MQLPLTPFPKDFIVDDLESGNFQYGCISIRPKISWFINTASSNSSEESADGKEEGHIPNKHRKVAACQCVLTDLDTEIKYLRKIAS